MLKAVSKRTPPRRGSRLLSLPLGLGAMLLLSACPGHLDDPERFAATCTLDVERDLLAPRCATSGCHATPSPSANLDLGSPGVADRLASGTSTCQGRPLTTILLDKVQPTPTCGTPMPMGGTPLSPQERDCLEQYVQRITDGGTP